MYTHTREIYVFFLKKWIWFSLPAAMRRVSHFFISCYQSKNVYLVPLSPSLRETCARVISSLHH